MASLTIRNLEDDLKARLRVQAASHGRSMEDEARVILRTAVAPDPGDGRDWVERLRERIRLLGGGVDLPIAPRESIRNPPSFD